MLRKVLGGGYSVVYLIWEEYFIRRREGKESLVCLGEES